MKFIKPFTRKETGPMINNHLDEQKDFENAEAFNITKDIRIEKYLPAELIPPVSLSKVFSVDPSQSFQEIYAKVVEKLTDPSFRTLD